MSKRECKFCGSSERPQELSAHVKRSTCFLLRTPERMLAAGFASVNVNAPLLKRCGVPLELGPEREASAETAYHQHRVMTGESGVSVAVAALRVSREEQLLQLRGLGWGFVWVPARFVFFLSNPLRQHQEVEILGRIVKKGCLVEAEAVVRLSGREALLAMLGLPVGKGV